MRITENTTLAELEIERTKLGIRHMQVLCENATSIVVIVEAAPNINVYGYGDCIAAAIDVALQKLKERLVATLT